jgi:integrase
MQNSTTQTWGKTKIQCLVRNLHSGVYYARARVNGKLIWRTLETDRLSAAKVRLPKALLDMGRGFGKGFNNQNAGTIETFGDVARVHLANVETRVDIKPATKHYWRQIVAALLASWPDLAERKTTKITEADAREWAAAYQGQVSPTRYNNTVDCLRTIFGLAVREGAIRVNPAAELGKVKVRAKHLQLPSREQFGALVQEIRRGGAWCSQACGDLTEFLAYSGCRVTEASHVQWNDVGDGTLWVHGAPVTGTKNSESRQIPIIPALGRLLEELKSNPRDVRDRKRQNGNYVLAVTECQKAIDTACHKLGMKRFTHHDLRHLFATASIESGVDIVTVSRWLGHRDGGGLALKTYSHLRNEHSQAMAAKVSF